MARIDGDTWDLASGVGTTATMVAAARAAASRRPRPAVIDEFAEPLVRAVGLDLFTRAAAGDVDLDEIAERLGFPRMVDTFAARAVFFDRFFADAADGGLRQVVIIASGLDTRPLRLRWPSGTAVYEIDQPEVIEFKTATLAKLGAVAAVEHRPVGIDLRDDWPAALQTAGFDPHQPTAWLAEGVLIGFLPSDAEVRLLDDINALSATDSRLAADYGMIYGSSQAARKQAQLMTQGWRAHGLDMDITSLTYPGEHTDVAAYLRAHQWDAVTFELADIFTAAGLPELVTDDRPHPNATIRFVQAVR